MSKKRTYSEAYLDFGFTFVVNNGEHLPQCVICTKTLGNGSMKPFQLKQHLQGCHPELQNKDREYFKLKQNYLKKTRLDSTGTFRQQTDAIVKASYEVSYKIAREKKPHTIGETLVKPCMLQCVKLVLGEAAHNKMTQISLSNNTIRSRINDMAESIKNQVVQKVRGSQFFSIQLDESTDVANLSQLLVFVRYTTEKGIAEEFLFCKPLQTTTKAQDVMDLINDFFEDSNISWESLVGVCTDGAPAMLGCRSGFVTLVKQKNPAVESTHCLIHKEALASRTLPKNFKQHLETVIKVVNFIKGSALNTRLFRRLCEGMEADHESLLFHTQVRWLSKGNMLQRVLELFDEVVAFLRAQENVVLLEALEGEFFRVRLSYLSDIFSALNELNRKLQGKGTNILFQSDKIRAFVAKLELWKKRAGSGSFTSFLALNECVEDMEDGLPDPIAEDIKQHLEGLEEEFKYYFPGITNESKENKLIRDPFQRNVDDVPEAWQEEFLDLKNDSAAKDAFQNMELEEFWTQVRGTYPLLATNALRILVQFSSTYLCETGFSALVHLKTKARNKLEVEADLRCALSITPPDIEGLVSGKQCQKSH